jgi:uncharacterized membrane protein
MVGLLQVTREAAVWVAGNARWMWWNLALAVVPLVLAVRLFRRPPARRSATWWAGVVAFVLFLPNAPYVLSDVIHLFEAVRAIDSDTVLSWAIVPQYVVFMTVGVGSFGASIVLVDRFVGQRRARWVRPALCGVCALGMHLGRAVRLNSWDALLRPAAVLKASADTFLSAGQIVHLAALFCVLMLLADAAVWAQGMRKRLVLLPPPQPEG